MMYGVYAQSRNNLDLTELSGEFQRAFTEKGWVLNNPLSSAGLIFTNGPTFYRVNDSVYWSNKDNSVLNNYVVNNDNIQDSVIYMLLGVHDSVSNKQIVDVYEADHLRSRSDGIFPNSGVHGEFGGGFRKFSRVLSSYLDSVVIEPDEIDTHVKLFFSNAKPYNLMRVIADNSVLKKQLDHYFESYPIQYSPAVRYDRPFYTYHELQIKKIESGFTIEGIDYGESFFCYMDSSELYFIEPLENNKNLKDKMLFIYDKKWTEEEFLTSPDILKISRELSSTKLLKVLKDFHNNQVVKPFSAMYHLSIEQF